MLGILDMPSEVLNLAFDRLGRRDLLSVIQACHSFHAIAKPLLYEIVTLKVVWSELSPKAVRCLLDPCNDGLASTRTLRFIGSRNTSAFEPLNSHVWLILRRIPPGQLQNFTWYLHVPLQPYNIQLLHNQQKNLLGLTVSSEMNQALVQHHWNVRRLSVVSIVSAATLEAVAKYINFPNPALNTLILIFTPRTDSGLPFFSSDRAVLPRMKHPWSYFNPEYDKDSDNDGTPATLSELLIRCLPMVGMQLGIALPKLTRLALHSCTGVGAVLRHWINLGAGAVALKWLSVVVQGGQSEECEADVHAFVRSFSGLHVLIIMLTHGAHTTLGDLARHLDTLYQLKLEFLIRVDSTFRPVMYASPEFLKGLRARAPPHLRELAVLVNRDCFDHMPDGIMGCVPLSVQYLQLGEMNGNIHDYGELLFGPHFPFCQGGFPENRVLALTGDVQGNQGVILQRGTLVGSGKLVKGRKPSLFYVQHVPNVLGKMQLLVTPLAEQEATELVGEIGLLSKWSKWSKW